MAEPFVAEIRMMSFNFAPKGWALCNGQLLPIQQNQALFSLLGTTYGGDGRVNFALPNLQGRASLHFGNGFTLGQVGGQAAHTLLITEMPTHTHSAFGTGNNGDNVIPTGQVLGGAGNQYGGPTNLTTLLPSTVGLQGGSQPHENMQPYLVINFSIALQGIFPSQS